MKKRITKNLTISIVLLAFSLFFSGCITDFSNYEEGYVDFTSKFWSTGTLEINIRNLGDYYGENGPVNYNVTVKTMTINYTTIEPINLSSSNNNYNTKIKIFNQGNFTQRDVDFRFMGGLCMSDATSNYSQEFGDSESENFCVESLGIPTFINVTHTTLDANESLKLNFGDLDYDFFSIYVYSENIENPFYKINTKIESDVSNRNFENETATSNNRIYRRLSSLKKGNYNLTISTNSDNTRFIVLVQAGVSLTNASEINVGDMSPGAEKNIGISASIPEEGITGVFSPLEYIILYSENGGYLNIPVNITYSYPYLFTSSGFFFSDTFFPGQSMEKYLILSNDGNQDVTGLNISCVGNGCQFIDIEELDEMENNVSIDKDLKIDYNVSIPPYQSEGYYDAAFLVNSSSTHPFENLIFYSDIYVGEGNTGMIYLNGHYDYTPKSFFNVNEELFAETYILYKNLSYNSDFSSWSTIDMQLKYPSSRIETDEFDLGYYYIFDGFLPEINETGKYVLIVSGFDNSGTPINLKKKFFVVSDYRIIFDNNLFYFNNLQIHPDFDILPSVEDHRGNRIQYYLEDTNFYIYLNETPVVFDSSGSADLTSFSEGRYVLNATVKNLGNYGSNETVVDLWMPLNITYNLTNNDLSKGESTIITYTFSKMGTRSVKGLNPKLMKYPGYCASVSIENISSKKPITIQPGIKYFKSWNITLDEDPTYPICPLYFYVNNTNYLNQGNISIVKLNGSRYDVQSSGFLSDDYINVNETFYAQVKILNNNDDHVFSVEINPSTNIQCTEGDKQLVLDDDEIGYLEWECISNVESTGNEISFEISADDYEKKISLEFDVTNDLLRGDYSVSGTTFKKDDYVHVIFNISNNLQESVPALNITLDYDTKDFILSAGKRTNFAYLLPNDEISYLWILKAKGRGKSDISVTAKNFDVERKYTKEVQILSSSSQDNTGSNTGGGGGGGGGSSGFIVSVNDSEEIDDTNQDSGEIQNGNGNSLTGDTVIDINEGSNQQEEENQNNNNNNGDGVLNSESEKNEEKEFGIEEPADVDVKGIPLFIPILAIIVILTVIGGAFLFKDQIFRTNAVIQPQVDNTNTLEDYLSSLLGKGFPPGIIKNALLVKGWDDKVIEDAISRIQSKSQSAQTDISQIEDYIINSLKNGYSRESIYQKLKQTGWNEQLINNAIDKIQNTRNN